MKDFPEDAFYISKVLADRPVVLYGAGECSHWFVEVVMRIHGIKPVVVLDKAFVDGGEYEGIPAFAPNNYQPSEAEKENAMAIIAIGKQEYYQEIFATLAGLGYQHIMPLHQVYEVHNPYQTPSALEESGFAYYRQQKENILAAYDVLEDDLSRDVFVSAMETHLTRRPVFLPKRERDEQYFPTDITLTKGHNRYICCGASHGDTLRLLHDRQGMAEAIACFEPEPALYRRLSNYLAEGPKPARNIFSVPCALSDHNGISSYKKSGYGYQLLEDGCGPVQCVTIDDALPGFAPTFISMDIEGSEMAALRGAKCTIQEQKPDLGICVYHCPSHFWEIPNYLKALNPNYRFYLRNHTGYIYETVLYATE